MKIILAGYNLDTSLLEKITGNSNLVTPETISAAYARVSRDPKPINELRKLAIEDVGRSRQSNEKIIFDMGHSSVAEHAVFNFDLIDISRLAVEKIQHHRLNSYTEKSQRYIKIGKDYIIPSEIKEMGLENEFKEIAERQFEIYSILYEKLVPYFQGLYPEHQNDKGLSRAIEGLAKEDARYALPLVVTTQLGMTINARNLEYMIQNLKGSKLIEIQKIGKELEENIRHIAPSLIKYTSTIPFNIIKEQNIKLLNVTLPEQTSKEDIHTVKLIDYTEKGEEKVIAALISREQNISFEEVLKISDRMTAEEKKEFFKSLMGNMQPWDRAPREFELVDFTFELIVSSSCFAQLKRHRMATILVSDYEPELGITIPPSIESIGMQDLLIEAANLSEKLYNKIIKRTPYAAPYVLTNSHRRRVIFKVNARELYHFSRLREDESAQWDIRNLAKEIIKIAKEKMPSLFLLTCGKDKFEKI